MPGRSDHDSPRPVSVSRRRVSLVVAALAAALRLAYVLEVHDHPYYRTPLVDAADYHARAMQVARGEGLGREVFYKAPAYPWLVGQVYRVTGPRLEAVFFLQMLGGVLTALLVAALGMRWFGVAAGGLGGVLAGLYVQLPYFENQVVIESAALFLSVLAVFLVERGAAAQAAGTPRVWFGFRGGMRPWLLDVAAGAAAGVALQLRPVNVALVLALLAWLLLQRGRWRLRLGRAACVALPVLVLLLPTLRHNRIATGRFVPVSVNGGINFYIGNNPEYDETVAIRPGLRWEALVQRFGNTGDPVRWQQSFYRAAFAWMRAQPLDYARLLAKKLVLFWNAREIDRNQDSAAMLGDSRVLRVAGVRWSLLAVPGLVGLVLLRRRARELPLHGLVLLQMLGVLAFFVTSRYRLVAVPWLGLAAGVGLVHLYEEVRARRRGTLLQLGAGLVAAAVVVLPDWMHVDAQRFGRPDFDRAEVLARRGDKQGALRAYERELQRHPDDPDVRFRHGEQLERLGQRDSACSEYRRAARLAPWSYKPMLALGASLLLAGDLERAGEALLEAARRGDPHGRSLHNLALVREKQGHLEAALDLYRQSLEKRDDAPEEALRHLGVARTLVLLGRPEEAEIEFGIAAPAARDALVVPIERAEAWLRAGAAQRALDILDGAPGGEGSARAQFVRARALRALGRDAEALAAGRRAVALDPGAGVYRDWLERSTPR